MSKNGQLIAVLLIALELSVDLSASVNTTIVQDDNSTTDSNGFTISLSSNTSEFNASLSPAVVWSIAGRDTPPTDTSGLVTAPTVNPARVTSELVTTVPDLSTTPVNSTPVTTSLVTPTPVTPATESHGVNLSVAPLSTSAALSQVPVSSSENGVDSSTSVLSSTAATVSVELMPSVSALEATSVQQMTTIPNVTKRIVVSKDNSSKLGKADLAAIISGCLLILVTVIFFVIIGLIQKHVKVNDGWSAVGGTRRGPGDASLYSGLHAQSAQTLVGASSIQSFSSLPSVDRQLETFGGSPSVYYNRGMVEVDQGGVRGQQGEPIVRIETDSKLENRKVRSPQSTA